MRGDVVDPHELEDPADWVEYARFMSGDAPRQKLKQPRRRPHHSSILLRIARLLSKARRRE